MRLRRKPFSRSVQLNIIRAISIASLSLVLFVGRSPVPAAEVPLGESAALHDTATPILTFTRELLPNGLTLIVQPNSSSDVVGMEVVSRVGTRQEDPSRAGVAALTLRVMTEGTRSWKGPTLRGWFEDRGSSLDARAHPDYSEIGAAVVSSHWPEMSRIFASLVSEASLTPESVTAAQAAMLMEENSAGRNEETATYADLRTLLSGGTAYGRSESGSASTLSSLGAADVAIFYRRQFSPSNLVVVVSGNVKPEEASKTLRTLFGPLQAESLVVPAVVPAAVVREPSSLVTAGYGDEAWIMVGYPTPGVLDNDYAAATVLNAVIGGSNSGILTSHFRDQAGVYESGSFLQPFAYQTHIAGYVRADPLQWDQQRQKMRPLVDRYQKDIAAIFDSLQKNGATAEQVAIARQFVIGEYLRAHERSRARAGYLGWYEAIGLGAGFDDQFLQKVKEVTPEAVNRLAARCFVPPHGATVVMFPRPRTEDGQ